MNLSPGTRLGSYEVLGPLGAGGMGEVYRARDTRLDREVALKVLPESFALDAERLARFEREAKTLASLNHPHIAQVHGFEEAGGIRVLAMELVEGDDLSQRIARGPLAVDEALPIARQIAEALEAAHLAGIVHRDLKPANIKVRPDGTVKVLDFGLAKAVEQGSGIGDHGSVGVMNSPTITTPAMTMRGVILGTAAYMAPEQAKGRPVDKRADVWAFGCVLFEMLTGRRAFDGDDMSEVMAAVIKSEPDWIAMPTTVPSHIQLLVRRCLEKDPRKRVGDAAVARFVLSEPLDSAAVATRKAAPTRRWPVAVGALAAIALVAASIWTALRFTASAPQPMRLAIVPAASQPLSNQRSDRDLVVSPDGRRIVYRSMEGGDAAKLVLRDVNQLEGRVLDGTDGARSPFFSPDGQWVAFFAANTLKKVAIAGGPPQTLCAFAAAPRGGTWHGDTIVFATADPAAGLQRVSAAGGAPEKLTQLKPNDSRDGTLVVGHWFPSFLPDGRRVLFSIVGGQTAPVTAVVDLQTLEQRIVVRGGHQAHFVAPGALVFADGMTLRAVAFDAGRAEVTGEPIPVLEGVCCSGGAADFAVSDEGLLVYVSSGAAAGQAAPGRTLVWVDRSGREEPLPGANRLFADPRISADGQQVAVEASDDADDIWTLDIARGALTRQTFEPGEDETATWMPDGKMLAYASSRSDKPRTVFRRRADGGAEEAVWSGPQHVHVETVTPDGRALILAITDANGGQTDLVLLPLEGDHTLKPLIQTRFGEAGARLSPDGRWLAYFSMETGRDEVYVRAYPSLEGKTQVSTGGGRQPVWSKRGDELFFRGEGAMMAVRVGPGAPLSVTAPRKLFDDRYFSKGNTHTGYDVARDGRFLMVKDPNVSQASPAAGALPQTNFIVVLNWFEELKQKLQVR